MDPINDYDRVFFFTAAIAAAIWYRCRDLGLPMSYAAKKDLWYATLIRAIRANGEIIVSRRTSIVYAPIGWSIFQVAEYWAVQNPDSNWVAVGFRNHSIPEDEWEPPWQTTPQ